MAKIPSENQLTALAKDLNSRAKVQIVSSLDDVELGDGDVIVKPNAGGGGNGGGNSAPLNPPASPCASYTYLQDRAALSSSDKTALISSLPYFVNFYLADKRDGQIYSVAKLPDDNLWFTSNLRISNYTCTPDDTDITEGTFVIPESSTNGFSDHTASNCYVDTTYGGYYTWLCATAGSGASLTADGSVASSSIAPKGWRLPTKDEYATLISKLVAGSNGYALHMPLAGYYYYSSLGRQGSYGYYWSSTAGSSTSAYDLNFDSSSAGTTNGGRNYGFSVRCVARE